MNNVILNHLDLWTGAVTKKSSGGRGSNGKVELTGVKKLRELILELAVRGKLVVQNDTDEPARDLLSRIAEEKSALISAGKLKKQTALPPISDNDTPYSLPSNWTWTRLGNYGADIHYGFTASANEHLSEYRLLRITDIQNDKVNWTTVPGCEISKQQAEPYLLSENDILIARTGGTIGKSFLVQDINVNAVFASYLIRLKKLETTYARYVKVFLGSHTYWSQLYEASMGTGQPNVNGKSLKNLSFPVPPIEEQHRIVQKVDELMALCDRLEQQTSDQLEAHETLVDTLLGTLTQSENATELTDNWARLAAHFDTLFTTEQSIDKLKQAILQLAVMGRLVEQDEHEESADRLLTSLSASPVKTDESPFSIPSNWRWTRLGSISRINGGFAFKSSNYQKTGVRVVRISDFDEYGFKNEAIVRHEYTEKLSGFQLAENDILMAMTGGTVGKSYLVEELPERMVVNQRVATIKTPAPIYAKYIYFLLKTKTVREVIENAKNSTNDNISMKDIQSFLVPLPPAIEQHRIVQKVDELMALCDQLKERLNQANETRGQLAGAVVEQAIS